MSVYSKIKKCRSCRRKFNASRTVCMMCVIDYQVKRDLKKKKHALVAYTKIIDDIVCLRDVFPDKDVSSDGYSLTFEDIGELAWMAAHYGK